MKNYSTLGVLISVKILIWKIFSIHKCIHDETQSQFLIHEDLEKDLKTGLSSFLPEERLLQSYSIRKMNFIVDYSGCDTTVSNLSIIQAIISKRIIPRIQSFMQVNSTGVVNSFTTSGCDSVLPFPGKYGLGPNDADMIVLVRTVASLGSTAATGSICKLETNTRRPTAGLITISLSALDISDADNFEETTDIITHEFFHVLGFSSAVFKYYKGGINEVMRNITEYTMAGTYEQIYSFITPEVVSWGKTHFNCPSLTSVKLENQGTAGSMNTHWEKSIMGNEMMTAMASGKMILSAATLSVFQDSGWYQIDMSQAENYVYGKGKGCPFLSSNCSSIYNEFCSDQGWTCSQDYMAKTPCVNTTFSDNCLYKEYISSYLCNHGYKLVNTSSFENLGANSRCFPTSLVNGNTVRKAPGCYRAQCINGIINLFIKNNPSNPNNEATFTCQVTGQVLSITSELTITCPNITDFCRYLPDVCPESCSTFGKCLQNGKCFCNLFTNGTKCEQNLPCFQSEAVCKIGGVSVAVQNSSSNVNPPPVDNNPQNSSTPLINNTNISSNSSSNGSSTLNQTINSSSTNSSLNNTNSSVTNKTPEPSRVNASNTQFNKTSSSKTLRTFVSLIAAIYLNGCSFFEKISTKF